LDAVNSFECITDIAMAEAVHLIFQNLFFLCHCFFLLKKKMRKKTMKIQQNFVNILQAHLIPLIRIGLDGIGLDWVELNWIGLDLTIWNGSINRDYIQLL
jgi:hypothetical protein